MGHHPASRNTVLGTPFFVAAIVMFFAVAEVSGKFTPNARAVALEHVPHLTFHKWELTNYRRNEPMYQLKCLAGCEFEPDWVKCHNVPAMTTGRGPSWQCETDLPSHLQFSTLEVVCEGYASRDDEFILDGSCGLEYSLRHVPLPFPNLESVKAGPSGVLSHLELEAQWRWFHWLVLGSVIYVCCYCLYHVVQDDLHEALTTECAVSACEKKPKMTKCNVNGTEREIHQGKVQRQDATLKARRRVFSPTTLESFDMEVVENENVLSRLRSFTPFLEMKGKLSLDLFQTT